MGFDERADRVAAVVEQVMSDLKRRKSGAGAFLRAREKYLKILGDLRAELEGRGHNPDLLLDLYGRGE